jgi:hypothetical protein
VDTEELEALDPLYYSGGERGACSALHGQLLCLPDVEGEVVAFL